MTVAEEEDVFICPACGGRQVASSELYSPGWEQRMPLGGAARRLLCAGCRRWIPGELAYRWGDLTEKQAQLRWRALFWFDETDSEAAEEEEESGESD